MSKKRSRKAQRGGTVSPAEPTHKSSQSKPGALKPSLQRALLLLGSLLVGLLLCETALRVLVCTRAGSLRPLLSATVVSTEIERSDPVRNHALVAGKRFVATGSPPGFEFCNYGEVNEQGLNNDVVPLEKAPGELRVLVLGDSFVEARQVPRKDNFCQVLQQRLAAQHQRTVRVINAGTSSYSPLLCYLYFTHDLAKYRPDVVVFASFANDVFDDMRYTQAATFDAAGLPTAVGPAWHFPGAPWLVINRSTDTEQGRSESDQQAMRSALVIEPSWLTEHFYLAALVRHTRLAWRLKHSLTQPPRNDEFFILEDNPELAPIQQQGWELTQRYITLLKTACDRAGARLVLTCVPIASQVTGHSSYDHFFFQGRPTDANQVNLKRIASELNVPFADLLSPLRNAGDGLYFKHDGHWTPKGHRVAAAALQETLAPMLPK